MNSDEAIKRLNIYSIRNNCLKLDRETFIEQNDTESEFVKDKVAIETVLNELDNSIPKSKIEAKIKELKEKCKKEYATSCTYCGNDCRYYSRCELCKELLRGEE